MEKLTLKRKILLGLFVFVVVFAPFSQHQALNQVPEAEAFFHDIPLLAAIAASTAITAGATTGQTIKDTIGDTIAWGIVNLIIDEMTRQTVNWISGNTGEGPQFVSDLPGFLGSVGNKVVGEFLLNEIPLVCSPFQLQVKAKLIETFRQEKRFQCTLTEAIQNVTDYENFVNGNFFTGGWEGWLSVSLPQNNVRGATLGAQTAIGQRIAQLQSDELAKLDWGQGFISFEQCPDNAIEQCPPTEPGGGFGPANSCSRSARICVASASVNGANVSIPVQPEIRTPGSVVQTQLNKALGAGQDRLIVADEINELVGALFTRLVSEVLSNPRGLLGTRATSIDNTTPRGDNCAVYGICDGSSAPPPGSGTPPPAGTEQGVGEWITLQGKLNSFIPGTGYSATISWSSDPELADSDVTLTLSGGSFGSGRTVGINGSATETLPQNTTFTLRAVGTVTIQEPGLPEVPEGAPGSGGETRDIQINEAVSITLLASTGGTPPGSSPPPGGGLPVGSVFFASNGAEYCDDDQNDEFGIFDGGGQVQFHINSDNGATFFIVPWDEFVANPPSGGWTNSLNPDGHPRCQAHGNFGNNLPFSPALTFTASDQDQIFTLPPADGGFTFGSYGGSGGSNEAFLTLLGATSGGGGGDSGGSGSSAPDFNSSGFQAAVRNVSDNPNSLNFRSKLKMARGGSASWDSSGDVLQVRWEEVPGWGEFPNEDGIMSFGQLHIIAFVRGAWYDWNIEDLQRPGENGGTNLSAGGFEDWVEFAAFHRNSPDEGFDLGDGDWFGLYIAAMPGGSVRSDILPVQYFSSGGSAVGSLTNQ